MRIQDAEQSTKGILKFRDIILNIQRKAFITQVLKFLNEIPTSIRDLSNMQQIKYYPQNISEE